MLPSEQKEIFMAWGKSAKSKKRKVPKSISWKSAANARRVKQQVEQSRDDLKRLAPLPPAEALYKYLSEVYKSGRKLQLAGDEEAQKALLSLTPHLRMKGGFNRFRVLLELTAHKSMSAKRRGRYGRALQLAHKCRVPSSGFIAFIEGNGGVNFLGDQKIGKAKAKLKKSKLQVVSESGDDWD
jgi:hypothetical protein